MSHSRFVELVRRMQREFSERLTFPDPESAALYQVEDQRLTIRNVALLCLISLILVPMAAILDHFAYPGFLKEFIALRLLCAGVLLGVLWSLRTPFGLRHHRAYKRIVPLIPAFFITLMIYWAQDPASPYYAGLILCLVAIGFVFHWTYYESLIATLVVVAFYSFATLPWLLKDPSAPVGGTINNFIFIGLNGLVIVCGSYFHHRIRMRDFLNRLELDRSRLDLQSKNQQLRDMDLLKNDFLANVSHELRTPLTLLLAPLQSLQRRSDLPADQQRLVETMHRQSLRLLKLINDLLDIAKLEAGQLKLRVERVPINEFLEGLQQSVSELAKQRNLTVTNKVTDKVGLIETDRDKLEKVCLNVLFNAIKFTPEFGQISLEAVVDEEDRVVFLIKDTGIGIPKERLPMIFERFWQEDSSAKRKHTGTGIGLALVKELTEAMGGHVTAESEANQGTIVRIILPRLQPRPAEPSSRPQGLQPTLTLQPPSPTESHEATDWITQLHREAEASPAHTSGVALRKDDPPSDLVSISSAGILAHEAPTIVIADDDPGMRRLLTDELIAHYQIIEAVDGRHAVEKVKQALPDLVLLDYMMPELDGFEVCQALRKEPETQMIPIILLTAKADEQTRLAGLEAGANDVLIKPFSLLEFHTRVRNLLRTRRLQKEVEAQKHHVEETLTQLRSTESQLVQSEKLAAVGQLSAAILHEINNPLNYSVSALYTLSKQLKQPSGGNSAESEEIIDDLKEGLNRVSTIVSDLRGFTHPDTDKRTATPLVDALKAAKRLVAPRLKEEEVHVREEIDPNIVIHANQNLLIQVFLNIYQNACDALIGRSAKLIEIKAYLDDEEDSAIIKFRDSGSGIPKSALSQVFDPFFTTKDLGKGTGLGLSICHRLIHEHQGEIFVESEPGIHTTFTIHLPRMDHESLPASQRSTLQTI